MRNILIIIFLLSFSFLGVRGQQIVNYEYEVTVQAKIEGAQPTPAPISFAYSTNFSLMQKNYNELKDIIETNLDVSTDEYNQYTFAYSQSGNFDFVGTNGMGVILMTENYKLILLRHDDGNYSKRRVVVDDDLTYYISCSKDGNKCKYTIEMLVGELQGVEKAKKTVSFSNTSSTIDLNDGFARFKVNLILPGGTHEEDSRIILFPCVIDCQTEDTIDYLLPATYEGAIYHKLQDKRKGFDYMAYDPLGGIREYVQHTVRYDTARFIKVDTVPVRVNGRVQYQKNADGSYKEDANGEPIPQTFIKKDTIDSIYKVENTYRKMSQGYIMPIEDLRHDTIITEKETYYHIYIDTVIVYKKPDINRTYRGFIRYTMEDYHHIYMYDEERGQCLSITPFKFLQMSNDAEELPLERSFYEPPKETPDDGGKDNLGMQFVYNTADLIEDSLYHQTVAEIEEDMQTIVREGGKLINPVLEAYASPDGNAEHNRALANRRAEAAKRVIHAPAGSRIATEAKIDTWEHTIELLEANGNVEEAEVVRNIISKSKDNSYITRTVRSSFSEADYQAKIKPVLDKQCRISFRYQYFMQVKLTPKQAKQKYMQNKNYPFSNGDYYNLYTVITDSAERDTLTEIAYNRVIARNKQYTAPIAPYLINEMALLKIRRMQPDSTILEPMLYMRGNFILNNSQNVGPVRVIYNRPQLVLNQAVMYYMLQDVDKATWFLDRLKDNNYTSKSYDRLRAYINFKELCLIGDRSPKQQADFEEALALVEQSGPYNRAVLYTEFPELNKRNLAWSEVHKIEDDSPLKWYLMAILWSTRDGKDEPTLSDRAGSSVEQNPLMTEEQLAELQMTDSVAWAKQIQIQQEFLQKYPDATPGSRVVSYADDADVKIAGIPYYMAYFQKSFDLDKEYMKYYFNEGWISEKMRQKKMHAYKNSRVPAYRKLFRLRKSLDDTERRKVLEREKSAQKRVMPTTTQAPTANESTNVQIDENENE